MRLAIADPPYPPQISERHDTATGVPRIVTRSRALRWYGDGPKDRGGNHPADFHLTTPPATGPDPATADYLTGPRCPKHTPAALAERLEATPNPARNITGLRRAYLEGMGHEYTPHVIPAGPTLVDERAIASGKRRSSPEAFRAARDAQEARR